MATPVAVYARQHEPKTVGGSRRASDSRSSHSALPSSFDSRPRAAVERLHASRGSASVKGAQHPTLRNRTLTDTKANRALFPETTPQSIFQDRGLVETAVYASERSLVF